MKKLVFSTVASATLLAIPASAWADEPYIGLSGGFVLPENSNNSGEFDTAVAATEDFGAIPAGTALGWKTEFDNGYDISGQIGYAFDNGLRTELQLAYNKYDVNAHRGLTVGGTNIDAVDSAVLTRGAADTANPTVGEVIADGRGDVSNIGIFANVFYDVDTGSGFKPYLGAGLGYQWVKVDYRPSGVVIAHDDDASVAYQLMGGASFGVSEGADIFAQYTYRANFNDAKIPLTLLPATLGVESKQSIVSAGVRIRLGG